MILAARKHLYAANFIFFIIIYIMQKLIKIFCIIEEKACKNANCPSNNLCENNCATSNTATKSSKLVRSTPSQAEVAGFRIIPLAMRKTMSNFGFGEGHFQIFVEEKQRNKPISKDHLNVATAELKVKE